MPVGGELRAQERGKIDAVIPHNADILINMYPLPLELGHAAQKGEVVGIEDARGPVLEGEQFARGEAALPRIVVNGCLDVFVRHGNAQDLAAFIKRAQALFCNPQA